MRVHEVLTEAVGRSSPIHGGPIPPSACDCAGTSFPRAPLTCSAAVARETTGVPSNAVGIDSCRPPLVALASAPPQSHVSSRRPGGREHDGLSLTLMVAERLGEPLPPLTDIEARTLPAVLEVCLTRSETEDTCRFPKSSYRLEDMRACSFLAEKPVRRVRAAGRDLPGPTSPV